MPSASVTKEGGVDLAKYTIFTEAATEVKQQVSNLWVFGTYTVLAAALKAVHIPWHADLNLAPKKNSYFLGPPELVCWTASIYFIIRYIQSPC